MSYAFIHSATEKYKGSMEDYSTEKKKNVEKQRMLRKNVDTA